MARKRALNPEQAAQLCARWLAGETPVKLAKEFGVHRNTITNIVQEAGLTAKMKVGATPAVDAGRLKKMIEDYGSIAEPNWDEPLEVQSYLYTMASKAAARCMTDPNYPGSESERLKDFHKHAASAQKLLPAAAMSRVAAAMKEEQRLMNEGAGPEVRRVPRDRSKRRPTRQIGSERSNSGPQPRPVTSPRKTRGTRSAPTRKES